MNKTQQELNKRFPFAALLAVFTLLMTASTVSVAGPTIPGPKWQTADETAETEVAYVDSVKKWGAWELDIEPAAGGLSQPGTQALNARNSKVSLRTNSISALAPPSQVSPVTITTPSTPIVPPVVPVTPPTPPITPTRPVVPVTYAPPAATPSVPITPPVSPSVAPVTPPTTIPSGTAGLF